MSLTPKIAKEFQSFMRGLSSAEEAALKESLERDGCTDPLIVWKETDILLDGHNRWRLMPKGKGYQVRTVSLPDRLAALEWIAQRQLARRNLTDEQASYFRGKLYLSEKNPTAGRPKKLYQSDTISADAATGAARERVAEKTGVSTATVDRDAAYAAAIDDVAAASGDDAGTKAALLSGDVKGTKSDIKKRIEQHIGRQLKDK